MIGCRKRLLETPAGERRVGVGQKLSDGLRPQLCLIRLRLPLQHEALEGTRGAVGGVEREHRLEPFQSFREPTFAE